MRAANRKQAMCRGAPSRWSRSARRRGSSCRGDGAAGRRAARARRASSADVARRARVAPLAALLALAPAAEQRILRFFGLPEPEIAATLRELDADGAVEVTTCLRRCELEVETGSRPADARVRGVRGGAARAARRSTWSAPTARRPTSSSRRPARRGWTVATGESCTGGMLASRLVDRAGSSAYVLGGVVAYSNEAKTALLACPG